MLSQLNYIKLFCFFVIEFNQAKRCDVAVACICIVNLLYYEQFEQRVILFYKF